MAALRGRARPRLVPWPLPSLGLPGAIVAAAVVVGAAALFPLSSLVGASVAQGEMARLQQERTQWEARMRELEAQVAYLASLERIEREARQRLGMAPPEEVIYLLVDAPAPATPELPPALLPPLAEGKESGRPWWERLLRWLPIP